MFTAEERENIAAGRMLRRVCDCGTLIWEAPSEAFLPRYTETVICHNCGRDHSRHPPLSWKLSEVRRRLKRAIRRRLLSG